MLFNTSGHTFNRDFIILNVRWYLQYKISYRNLEKMALDRGVVVDSSTICRWVIKFSPDLEKAVRKNKPSSGTSWRLDETYIKVKGQWKYLYRAVDKEGQTVDYLLTAKRDRKAAKRFLKKAIKSNGLPEKINIDRSGANTVAINDYNKEEKIKIEIRQNKYLNNIIEQDHRSIKQLCKATLGFQSFRTAQITLSGFECMKILDKKQIFSGGKSPARHFYTLIK